MNITVNRLTVLSKKTDAGITLYWHKGIKDEDVWGGLDNALAVVAPMKHKDIKGAVPVRLVDAAMIG